MTKTGFIGREYEIEKLENCLNAGQAQLIVVYGRRRVGKTYLVESFFEKRFAFCFTGAYDQPKSVQLKNFADEIRFQTGRAITVPKSWREAFGVLREYLSSLDSEKKQVVFLDELPWMDTHRSDFRASFEWFWNGWGSKQDNLIMVVCGSATAWMVRNISGNKGGLFNRHTCRIYLKQFDLRETEEYLKSKGSRWSRLDIASCYMIMGGMPYYLNLLDAKRSLGQNIDKLFFREKGDLWDEFYHLYHTLFTNGDQYAQVVELLSSKKSGLTRSEISEKLKTGSNSTINKILQDLEASEFIRVYAFYGQKKKDARYQLRDYYSLFYFRFIKDRYGKDESFWSQSYDNPQVVSWYGLAFEQLCKDHIRQIKKALGISGVVSEQSEWYAKGNRTAGERGAQIDLLIDRRDRAVNICELKFSENRYEIDRDYEENLRNKIDVFKRETGCKKTLILTMITTYGLVNNRYSGMVNSQVTLDDLFAEK